LNTYDKNCSRRNLKDK